MSGEGVISPREIFDRLNRVSQGARAHSIAARSGRAEWSVLLVVQGPDGSIRRNLSPEEAEALAADLQRNAKLAREPGRLP